MSSALYGTGVGAGLVASVVAPHVFERAPASSIATVVVLGFAAGANGAMTVAQRLVLASGDSDRLGRLLLGFQIATVIGVTVGGVSSLLAASIVYAVGPTALVVTLLRSSEAEAVDAAASAAQPFQADPCDA